MQHVQPDLFGPAPLRAEPPDAATLAMIRERLHKVLAMVRTAQTMPWTNQMTIIHEDNRFRMSKDLLPPEEGAALWAEFDAHMDRLYAIMNEGKDLPPED